MPLYQIPIGIVILMAIIYYVSVMLCSMSLGYRVAIFKPSKNALEVYLNSLGFPLTILIARPSPYNVLRIKSRYDDPLEILQEMSLWQSIPLRLISGTILLVFNFLFLTSFGTHMGQRDVPNYLANLCILTFGIACFIWAWRFGHQLKAIDMKIS